jgi:hypothetical protein
MNCEDFRRELETAVENRVTPDFSESREHLKHCKRCRALWEDFDIIERAVAEWGAVDEDAPDLSGRVLAVLANDREAGRPLPARGSRPRIVPVLVGLSVVALLFLAFYLSRNPDQNRTELVNTPTELEDELNTPQFEEREPVEMERVVSDTRAAYESLINQVTGPFEPLKNEMSPGNSGDEDRDRPEEPQEKSPRSVPPQFAELQSEVVKPLGFLTAVFPSPSSAPR